MAGLDAVEFPLVGGKFRRRQLAEEDDCSGSNRESFGFMPD
jgi:hypothetical protein